MQQDSSKKIEAAWAPQPGPQADAFSATWCPLMLYGGAKFGGKTDFLLGDFLQDVERYRQHWHGIVYRRTMPELDEVIQRSHEIYPLTGAIWKEQKKTWLWPQYGSSLKMRALEKFKDIGKYQGHSYTWIGFDEAGNWPTDIFFRQVGLANLRWGRAPVPTKRIRLTANPGGVGHTWIKNLFISPAPKGFKVLEIKNKTTGKVLEAMFIPALIGHNKIGLKNDPDYIDRLHELGSPTLVQAWLEGNWDIIQGAYFPEYDDELHTVPDFTPPSHWFKFRSMDWGSAEPFAVHWWAVSDGQEFISNGRRFWFPAGALICYREWYGCDESNSSKGIRLINTEIARGIKERTREHTSNLTVTDILPFADRGHSKDNKKYTIADEFFEAGVPLTLGNTRRIQGWSRLRSLLVGFDGFPMIYLCESCEYMRQYIPALTHNESNYEDAAESGEATHCTDSARYAAMTRPKVHKAKKTNENIVKPGTVEFRKDELLRQSRNNPTGYRR